MSPISHPYDIDPIEAMEFVANHHFNSVMAFDPPDGVRPGLVVGMTEPNYIVLDWSKTDDDGTVTFPVIHFPDGGIGWREFEPWQTAEATIPVLGAVPGTPAST